jgi:hypothetical protein
VYDRSNKEGKMTASKENAMKALEVINKGASELTTDNVAFLKEFLEACYKKLPTEGSYAKDRSRRTIYKLVFDEDQSRDLNLMVGATAVNLPHVSKGQILAHGQREIVKKVGQDYEKAGVKVKVITQKTTASIYEA